MESYAGSMEMNPSGSSHVLGAKNIVANFLLVFSLKSNESRIRRIYTEHEQ